MLDHVKGYMPRVYSVEKYEDKAALRKKLERDMALFEAFGGKVEQVDIGVTAETANEQKKHLYNNINGKTYDPKMRASNEASRSRGSKKGGYAKKPRKEF